MKDYFYLKKGRQLLFALLVLLAGGASPAWADELTENFDEVKRLDANGNEITSQWTYGYSLSNGWFVSPAANVISASNSYHYGIATGGNTGNALWAAYGSSQSYYLVIPTQIVGEVKFKAKKTSSSSSTYGYISLYEVTKNDDTYTVTSTKLGTTVSPTTNSAWNDYSINIGEEGKYVALHMIRSGLDDFEATIYEEGGIAKPTNFTASNTTYNSTQLSWTAGGEETAWQIVYDTDASFDKDAATPVDVTENPYTLTELAEGTTYYAYIRAKIGDVTSSWSSKISFTTTEQFPKPTAFAATGYTATTASFAWTAGSTETAWQIAYSTTQGFDPADGTIADVTTNPYTLEGLTAETTYYARIRANYGSNFSAWSDEVSFTPSAKMNLVVNDGTYTNSYVPFYGSYVDTQGTMSQFIFPADNLTTMANRQITKMTFYSSSTSKNWNAKFKIYLKEVNATTFDSKECDWTGMEEVDEATVSLDSNGEMVIELDTPYDYAGGNLMVGFNLTVTGSYSSCSWYGVNSGSNTARYSYVGYSGTENAYASFIPKVTITSMPGSDTPKAKMTVTQPESLDYGVITAATDKTFTIANTGDAALEGIEVTSNNAAFTIKNAPTTLEAGASAEVTITMSASTTGEQSATINISASNVTKTVDFTVTGIAVSAEMSVINFNDNQLPSRWDNAGYNNGWKFTDGAAYAGYSSSSNRPKMTTPKVVVEEGDMLIIKAKVDNTTSIYYVTINGSSDNGATWTAYTKKLDSNTLSTEYKYIVLSDIPTTVNRLQFEGYYGSIDEIWGINYAPELSVTQNEGTVTSPANYDFGEIAVATPVTYTFANAGAGTINITGVAIAGDGAAAYSTNWAESVAVPFDLVITRNYDADRTEAQDAVVTVTTSEGDFVINVTGTDKAANAPELAVTPNEDAAFGVVTAASSKTYTVTNAGTGTLTVDIASDDAKFTVSAAQLADIAAGQSKTFDVIFTPVAETYGTFNANITITPTYDAEAAVVIAASAKVKDPNVWSEDFSGSELPDGWDAGANWSIENGVAKAAYAYGSTSYLTTPTLTVSGTDDVLTFDYAATANYVSIKIQMSKDGAAFADYSGYPTSLNNGDNGTFTITGLEAGDYQFRFTNDDYTLDNFEGFKLNLADHILVISSSNLPASTGYSPTMKEGQSFEATITLTESRGINEDVTINLYGGEDIIGTTSGTVSAKESKVFTITATPTTTGNVMMHFEVVYAGGQLTTSNLSRYVEALTYLTLDETSSEAIVAGTYDNVTLKRTFIAGWNTVCLPFTISDVEEFFGTGAKAYEFSSFADGSTLTFEPITTLTASYPYIVYVPNAITEDFELTDITIESKDATAWYTRKADSNNKAAYFRGTYAPVAAGEWTKYDANDIIYGVTTDAKIAKAGETASIDGFRAYFDLGATVSTARLAFTDDGGQTTYIDANRLNNVENGKAYNLQGQRVENLKKGLYIINGKKKVVRK